MSDQVIGVTIKGIGDFSDVVSNVGNVQKALTKLKLPDKLGDSLNKNISNFMKEYDKYQKKIAEGIHTQGDQNAVNKSLNSMLNSYEKIIKDFGKISSKDFKDIFNLDEGQFASVQKRIKDIEANIKKIKLDPKQLTEPLKVFQDATKAKSLFGNGKGFDRLDQAFKNNNLEEAKQAIIEIDNYLTRFGSRMDPTKLEKLNSIFAPLKQHVLDSDNAAKVFTTDIDKLNNELSEIGGRGTQELNQLQNGLKGTDDAAKSVITELKQIHANEFDFNRQAADIDRQIQSYFGLSQMIRKVGDIARDAFATVKELDAAMTQTAVVTNFSVGDMWDMLPTYTQQANQLGSTIKDVYEAATLYYQQGLNTNQAMSLANETLKMARIAGLDAAEATNMMTAALRGFNMEINQVSAQKINDIYSELAAITASDTKEIGSAMERTASIANAANMDFATTSAFLAQMIETTREAPENLGTAMKTIVARFQEMKQDPTKLVDSEGVAMDVNKVDKALKTIGVSLTNTKGEFRDLDDVFLDISAKWDSLSQGQQRYIATIAAGSRQQSRFIAMMSDYERTMELVDAANNSAGASQRQFEKTLDSMGAKLNMLKNAWDQFTMGLMNNQILKFGVDALTEGFTIVNKFIDILGKLPPKPFEGITKSALTLATTLGMLSFGKRATRGLVTGGAGWWKGETSLVGGFKEGWASSSKTGLFKNKNNTTEAERQGTIDGQAYGRGWSKAVQMLQTKQKTGQGILSQTLGIEQFKKNQAAFGSDNNIINSLFPKGTLDEAARQNAQDYLNTLRQELHSGKISKEDLPTMIESGLGSFDGFDNKYVDDVAKGLSDKKIKSIGIGFDGLTAKANSAGVAISNFGAILQGTPLEPFGQILGVVGGALISLSTALATTKAGFLEQWAAAFKASIANEADAVTAFEATIANEGLSIATLKSAGAMGVLGTAIWATLWPLLAIAAAIGAVVLIAKGLDAAIETNKEKLESATDAAAAASEAYDSAKQETSELADAIEQVKSNEEAFDGLVAGTAAFNEQLVTANDQIMDLIKKYPMLNDYLTTDKNGLMHISDEGLEAVKEYQKQRQANASALNLIQAADLNSVETQQKAEQMRKTKGTDTTETLEQRKKEADLLEQQAEAQQQMAKLNAVNAALVDKEIGNREKVSAIMADQYDARRDAISLEGESIHDLKQEYADFYGYTYDKSTKKIKDVEGNEIDVSNDTIKDAVKDIRVITDIEVDAGSVDTAISSIDRKFSKHFKGDGNFFSDILSDNIETNEDLLREVLQDPGKLQETVSELSSKEIAAIMGVSADAVDAAPDKYSKDLINKLTEKAENIAEAQSEAWGEFGSMLAQAEGMRADAILEGRENSTNLIQRQLTEYTAEQRDLMVSIGKSLESGAGVESMKSFIRNASNIYREGTEETINELNGIIKDVNWDSPTARLKAYKDLTNSTTPDIQKMGNELLESADSANLLGEAFEEFYNSSDWAEVSENMDSFVDSTGKINAVGVEEMAKQCNSLNNLLDTGAISAGGVAAAINALGTDGELTLLDLNSAVLQLLSTFGQLDNIIGQAHQSIENFDWGIDTGESADFVKESAEKWNELYNNGEVGNPQLEAYAKYVLGEEKYIKLLNKNHGNLQDTMDTVAKYVNEYADGFDKAWDSLANGSWQGKVPKELQDLGISFGYDDNGNWEWNPGSATTEQLSEWLQAVKGIGPEMAAAMIEDWQNYSPDFRAERQKNDFYAGLDDYIAQRSGDNGVTITTGELDTIAAATGESVEDVKAAIVETAEKNGQKITEIDNTVEGITSEELNTKYNEAKTGNANQSWLQELIKTGDNGQKQVDASQAITQAIGDGFTQTQAETMAYDELSKAVAEGTEVWYKDKLLTPEDLASFDSFKTAIEDFENSSQWVEVGKAIAEGVVSYIEGKDNPNNTTDSTSNKNIESTPTVVKPSQQDNKYTDTGTGRKTAQEVERQPLQKLWDLLVKGPQEEYKARQEQNQTATGKTAEQLQADNENRWKSWLSETKRAVAEAKDQKLTAGQQNDTTSTSTNTTDTTTNEAENGLQEAGLKLQEGGTQIGTAATKLESAATKLETAASNLSKPEESNSKNSTAPKGTTVPGVGFVESSAQSAGGDININTSEADTKITALQTKLKTLNDSIAQGGTYKLDVSGVKEIKAAAAAAKTLNKNSGTKTIGVKTGKADTSSVDAAKTTIGNTQAKIQVGANVDSAIAAARRAQRTINGMSAKLDVSINQTGNRTVSIVVKKSGSTIGTTNEQLAKGKNNHGIVAPPSFGSVARGKYGQVGPKGKGGLTLTGELGYEVAWLPDENRSMILGADGPQMVDLPKNVVVWDHEQSKKIVKQKAIPAGSHSTSTRPGGITTSSSAADKIVSTAKKTGDKLSKTASDTAKAVNRVLVWWDNAGRRSDALQRQADKNQKTYEKYLKDIQATLKTTGTDGGGNKFIANTQKAIVEYERQFNRAVSELNALDRGSAAKTNKGRKKQYKNGADNIVQVSYKKGKKQKTAYMNTAGYIYYDEASGSYQINEKALNGIKNADKRKAFYEAAQKELNDRISKKNAAEDNIEKAREALEKFGEELYNTFFAWEVELTKIWNITQQIETTEAKISRAKSYQELLNARLANGITTADQSSQDTFDAFKLGIEEERKNIQLNIKSLSQQREDLQRLLDSQDERKTLEAVQDKLVKNVTGEEKLNATEETGYKQYAKELESTIDTQLKAWKYLNVQQFSDGTVEIDFDTKDFETDKLNATMTSEQGKAIQDYVKSLVDSNKELNNIYNTITTKMTEMNQSLSTLQDQWVGYANELWQISEEEQKKEVDNLKKLNDSLTNSLKNLLDDVKRKLDQRRKQEDNAKTEQDIAQKQQRLAALRADTSGGHQVEIAQLQSEIADAQQNYQRTLEDQLLDNLQQQADVAAEQRERQITLQEELITAVNNASLVNQWMNDPVTYKDAIFEAYKTANDFDEKPQALQEDLIRKFEVMFEGLKNNQSEQEEVNKVIEELEKERADTSEKLAGLTDITGTLNLIKESIDSIKLSNGIKLEKQEGDAVGGSTDTLLQTIVDSQKQPAPNTNNNNNNNTTSKLQAYKNKVAAAASNKKMGANEFKSVVAYAQAAGVSMTQMGKDLANTSGLTWKQVVKAAKKAGYSKNTVTNWWGGISKKSKAAIADWKKYATGGLANYTGPAWLDGTPSKPELVLNATDTRNFLALRDVLSKVMGATNSVTNSYGGNATYEININVDKIEKDYDVDRVAERVKKIIVKDSGYRNVTQVRNFR